MMKPFPNEHELIWLFECEPEIVDKNIPWAYNQLIFTTVRENNIIKCEIEPAYQTLKFYWFEDDIERLNLDLNWVAGLQIKKENGVEALVASFRSDNSLNPVIIQLKPYVKVSLSTRRELQ